MDSRDARCGLLAAEQHGCITLAQAARCGISGEGVRRRVREGRWRRILPRVYVVRGAPSTWEQRLFAAVLWAGDAAAVSGPSAAALWGFPEFARAGVEISYPGAKQSRAGVTVRRVALELCDVARIRGIPVTSPARTLADIAGMTSIDRFDAAFHYCLHANLTCLASLEELAHRRAGPGFRGCARLREAVAAYAGDPAAASPLEARLARRLRSSNLPPARRQHEVRVEGRRRYLDFAWPHRLVAVEVDGYRWHSSRSSWRKDRDRLGALRRAGWTIVHAARDDVDERFDRLAKELQDLLR